MVSSLKDSLSDKPNVGYSKDLLQFLPFITTLLQRSEAWNPMLVASSPFDERSREFNRGGFDRAEVAVLLWSLGTVNEKWSVWVQTLMIPRTYQMLHVVNIRCPSVWSKSESQWTTCVEVGFCIVWGMFMQCACILPKSRVQWTWILIPQIHLNRDTW